jgi:tRNA pseudouridine38-40 synthase
VRRFRMTVEYDGTDFAGFQLQEAGLRTVQGALEVAILRVSGEAVRIHGAGRTDTGVHATGQVVHFDAEWPIPAESVGRALNGALPDDLKVRYAAIAAEGFHSRFSATARTYRYVILNRQQPSALLGRFSWHLRDALDVDAMQAAAAELVGVHDFATFGQPDLPGKSTVRRMYTVAVERPRAGYVQLTVRGNAFLRQQVRSFVGALGLVGQGRLTPGEIAEIRDSRDRLRCPAVAPAKGLTLVHVDYEGVRISRPEPPEGDAEKRDAFSCGERVRDDGNE